MYFQVRNLNCSIRKLCSKQAAEILMHAFAKLHFDNGNALLKGTNGRQKTYEIFHVYCVFYSGFMCQTTLIFGITKDGSLVLTTLAS